MLFCRPLAGLRRRCRFAALLHSISEGIDHGVDNLSGMQT